MNHPHSFLGGTRTGSTAPLAEDHGGSFVEFIRTQMDEIRDDDAKSPFEELLNHPFLSANDFVSIENFLTNLPVKKYSERVQFFQTLADRLEKLPPTIVASQLGPLLLSRMVLLGMHYRLNSHFTYLVPTNLFILF